MSPQTTIFDLQAELCLAMGHSVRQQIVHLLHEGPKRVNAIAEELDIRQATASRHLAVLRNAGILSSTRHGTDIVYQIANPRITEICEMMRAVLAERANQRSGIFQNIQE
ncbi:MAG TPA: metalloregulator ArsR/SmtB family transcription factor [Anaerolineales bacterium]|jgi:ArsR family transcriptional regulator|nr:metalloregulator ArsR/SmtB family transcription factor [Anaerolineales bacterium]HRK91004.1 metalloregulator ArsR/SmtB family transcription factor [Anaerolineales bacterium]